MKILSPEAKTRLRSRSRLVHLGRDGEASQGFVSVPPYRGSTVLFPDVETLTSGKQRYTYGRTGTPTTAALCEAWTIIAGAAGTVLAPSGKAAIAVALMSALSAGDHLLMTDSAYDPTRAFCNGTLKRMGSRRPTTIRASALASPIYSAPTPRRSSLNGRVVVA